MVFVELDAHFRDIGRNPGDAAIDSAEGEQGRLRVNDDPALPCSREGFPDRRPGIPPGVGGDRLQALSRPLDPFEDTEAGHYSVALRSRRL